MSDRDDEFLGKLKSLGLEEVRRKRADRIYGERKQRIVDEWIESQERERSESSREEDLGIRRYVATTQRTAATTQKILAAIAIIGVTVSIIALFISVF